MRIAYLNTYFQRNHTGGGHVHMGQFIANASALGHEIWTNRRGRHPDAHAIPTSRLGHIRTMWRMDALYVRVESSFPKVCSWSMFPRRLLYGFPVVAWEFNTVPEHALLCGRPDKDVKRTMESFKHYGRGCDLAVCMTQRLGEQVRDRFGIQRVLVVPNGSDPGLFRPDVPVVNRMRQFLNKFNVAWIGTGKEPWHDFEMIGEVARLLCEADSGKNIVFHMIGPDVAGVMANMPPNVFYWGAESYKKLPGWLSGMHVGLSLYRQSPATDDATPLKVFDYMASGLTVVSTPLPFMKELFSRLGQSDLIVPPGDSKLLANVLIGLASDRERVRHQGQAGRRLVIEHYNWRRAVQDTMNEMEKILREKGKAPKA